MIKNVMVCMSDAVGKEAVVGAAARFAAKHGAVLTGLFIDPGVENALPAIASVPPEVLDMIDSNLRAQREQAKALFDDCVGQSGCEADWYVLGSQQNPLRAMYYQDAVFVAQPRDDVGKNNDTRFVNRLIMESALPVFVVPEAWQGGVIGENIMLAWVETREAQRATQLALPLMKTADHVDVLTITRGDQETVDLVQGVEISAYLTRRDIDCRFSSKNANDEGSNESTLLLSHANSVNADLIVMGGYGHSRLREIILGGVTRNLVASSNVPLMLCR